jgi:hypothetical protein
MAASGTQHLLPPAETRRITAVALVGEDGHATFQVGPKPGGLLLRWPARARRGGGRAGRGTTTGVRRSVQG